MKSKKKLLLSSMLLPFMAINTIAYTPRQYLIPNNKLEVEQCETPFRRGKQYKTPTKRDPLTKKAHKKLIKERRKRKGKRR